ncbi:MAG: hypothetical protein OFPII_31630 [Osedax symbiont Rs1]|nr:MAG: hypothetical protein OFPII_31630 [Osedax symbiont Rs1]
MSGKAAEFSEKLAINLILKKSENKINSRFPHQLWTGVDFINQG